MSNIDANVEFARAAYAAIQNADIPWMQEHTHPDVVFVQGGHFPTAGTYHGRDAMFGHFFEFMTMVEGNFTIAAHDFLASDDRVAVPLTVTIDAGGEHLEFDEVHLWRIEDGVLLELRAIPFDPYAVDEFFARTGLTPGG